MFCCKSVGVVISPIHQQNVVGVSSAPVNEWNRKCNIVAFSCRTKFHPASFYHPFCLIFLAFSTGLTLRDNFLLSLVQKEECSLVFNNGRLYVNVCVRVCWEWVCFRVSLWVYLCVCVRVCVCACVRVFVWQVNRTESYDRCVYVWLLVYLYTVADSKTQPLVSEVCARTNPTPQPPSPSYFRPFLCQGQNFSLMAPTWQ